MFILLNEVAGIYNAATICFVAVTGEFWSVLPQHRCMLTRSEVRKMSIETAPYKKVSND